MGEAKFTKEKWEVIDGHYPSIIEIKCGECMRMPVVMHATDVTFEQGLEREANAHLIAAAPEMYEVLDILMDASDLGDAAHLMAEERKNIMSLLAKARGEFLV